MTYEITSDEEGFYAVSEENGITIYLQKDETNESKMCHRRIIKQNSAEQRSILIAQLKDVFLYVTEDNKFILTTNSELR